MFHNCSSILRTLGLAGTALAALTLIAAYKFGPHTHAADIEQRARILVTEDIDEHKLVTLRGNTRPEARRREHDRGKVPDRFPLEHMLLQLQRPPELQQEFDSYVESLTQGKSANFHQWLDPEQVGLKYGLSDSDLRHIERWLQRHGFRVNYVYPNRVVMDISATAKELREAMGVDIHFLEVNGEQHFANVNDPEIPEALEPAIVGIVGIHDFKPHPMFKMRTQYTFTDASGTFYAVTPPDLAAIYNFNPLFGQGITGAGQTVAMVEDSDPFSINDWTTFVNKFNLAPYGGGPPVVTHPNPNGVNNCSPPGVNPDDGEVELDMEYATAAAPGAAINVATCSGASGVLIAIQNLVASNPHPYIISVSYGECETLLGVAGNAAFKTVYQTAASEGISVFVAAGDQGPSVCDPQPPTATTWGASNGITVSGLASTFFNVAVAGTDYGDTFHGMNTTYWNASNNTVLQSANGYIREIPWNNSCASVLLTMFVNPVENPPYGPSGFCADPIASLSGNLTNVAGSGGPSACATGAPSSGLAVGNTCAGYVKPPWQSGLFGNPNDSVRDLPDVSIFAANGVWAHFYIFCYTDAANGGAPCTDPPDPNVGRWSGAGGTSFGAPIFAGIQALVNQRTSALTIPGTPGQGNPNPVYYAIAKAEFGAAGSTLCDSSTQPLPRRGVGTTCVFYDVTEGDLDVNCMTGTPNCFGGRSGNLDGVLSTGGVSGLTLLTNGSGYTSAPTCTISAPNTPFPYNGYPGGSQATCTATSNGLQVTGVTLTNAGAGYAPNPLCTLSGGGGSGATCRVSGVTIPSYEPSFAATPGWDFATGIGTPNVYNLVFSPLWAEGP